MQPRTAQCDQEPLNLLAEFMTLHELYCIVLYDHSLDETINL